MLLIVYHSATGGTRQMAEAALAGAREEGEATLLHAAEAGPDHLLAAAAYLFAAPENLASLAGTMKDFFDRTYYPVLDRLQGVADPVIICTHAQTPEAILAPKKLPPEDLARCHDLGALLAAGLALGIY